MLPVRKTDDHGVINLFSKQLKMVKEVVDQEAIKMVNGRMRSWSTSHWDEGYSLFFSLGPKLMENLSLYPQFKQMS